ncbi:MAG: XdhC family protein [Anaerolineales bacterium]
MTGYQRLAEIERSGEAAALATVIRTSGSVPRHIGSKMLIFPDGKIEGTIGGGQLEQEVIEVAKRVIDQGALERVEYSFRDPDDGDVGVCGGEMEVLVEPIKPPPTVVVIGAGHVGQAVAHLAGWLGFHVVVADDRQEFVSKQISPAADELICAPLSELAAQLPSHDQSYMLLTTRGVDVDLEVLPPLLETKVAYIGVIGSRRRWETTAEALRAKGISAELIERVSSPIGLELNAETPEEIALSMLAEVVMLRRGGTGQPMGHLAGSHRRPQE